MRCLPGSQPMLNKHGLTEREAPQPGAQEGAWETVRWGHLQGLLALGPLDIDHLVWEAWQEERPARGSNSRKKEGPDRVLGRKWVRPGCA